jgi:hypothetical protein
MYPRKIASMMNNDKANSAAEPGNLIRQFAVTDGGRPKYPIVNQTAPTNVVRLDEYRLKQAQRQRPPST